MAQRLAGQTRLEPQVLQIQRDGMEELFVTGVGAEVDRLLPVVEDLQQSLQATVIAGECFGPTPDEIGHSAMASALPPADVPLTWVRCPASAEGLGGVHLRAVAGAQVTPLLLDGQLVGTVVEGPHASEVMLAGIHPADPSAPREQQARATFERIEQALSLAGMDFSHVARTWLFLDDILSWYGDFNRARTAFFAEHGVFDRLVPASTGIGAANIAGASMVAGAYAVKPTGPGVTVRAVPSPLQCPALDYGSSFSRAVEVVMPDLRRLFISGTASIAPDGQTCHVGDVAAQTALTCEVIAAILQSGGMGWEDVTRATAYVRFGEDAGAFDCLRAATGMPALPLVVSQSVICRDDLLFELEVDAVQVDEMRSLEARPVGA